MKHIFFSFSLIFLLASCSQNESEPKDNQIFEGYAQGNIFADSVIQNIYDFGKNSPDFQKPLADFSKSLPEYKKSVLLQFASLQNEAHLPVVETFLLDLDSEIRAVAAFAAGQIGGVRAETLIINSLKTETSPQVIEQLLIALGKCGDEKSLEIVQSYPIENQYPAVILGVSEALGNFAERNIKNVKSAERLLEILQKKDISNEISCTASYALFRLKSDLKKFDQTLITIYNSTEYIYTKSNIVKASLYSQTPVMLGFLKVILKTDSVDYRIRVNAVKALISFKYDDYSESVFPILTSKNIHEANSAAQFFYANGKTADVPKYLDYAKKSKHKLLKSKLLATALKYSKDKHSVSELIKKEFERESDIYAKAALLEALGEDIAQYRYVMHKTFFERNQVLSTSGITALSAMRNLPEFNDFAKKHSTKKENIEADFAEIFQKAILSGDAAMMALAAQTIRDERFNYASLYKNTFFVKQGLKKCVLPRDYEAYVELLKADAYLNGAEYPDFKALKLTYYQPEWSAIYSVPVKQRVKFTTTRGSFVIELDVNSAPVSVENFVRLVWEDYFDNKAFHRVVPDFVVQTGCPRGDGWGAEQTVLKSEFSMKKFEEGSVGYASSGKDTESVQWFVTLSPAYHLNGRYTNFGTVTEGMEVIHNIELGDRILDAELML